MAIGVHILPFVFNKKAKFAHSANSHGHDPAYWVMGWGKKVNTPFVATIFLVELSLLYLFLSLL
jgi:hypothetical protein